MAYLSYAMYKNVESGMWNLRLLTPLGFFQIRNNRGGHKFGDIAAHA